MAKPTSISGGAPDIATQKTGHFELVLGDVENARFKKSPIAALTEDRSSQFPKGVNSVVIHDMEAPGIEDTKCDGSEQSDLAGGATPQTLSFDQYKSVPGYFYYKISEAERVSYLQSFLSSAPNVVAEDLTNAVISALRGIGASNYRQLSGTNLEGVANSVLDKSDVKAGKQVIKDLKLDMSQTYAVCSENMEEDLPLMFDFYDAAASSSLGDEAKMEGFITKSLGLPIFIDGTDEMTSGVITHQAFIFHRSAVSWAVRTNAVLDVEDQPSKARTYYGLRISYGVNRRSGDRGLVLQNTAAFTA